MYIAFWNLVEKERNSCKSLLPVKYFPDKIFPVISLVEDSVFYLPTPTVHADFLPVMKLETGAFVFASLTGSCR